MKLFNLLIVCLLLISNSCSEDFLEVIPRAELSVESVFSTQQGAELLLNEIYKSLPDPEGVSGRHQNFHSTYENLNMFSHYYVNKFNWAISHVRSEDRAYGSDAFSGRTGIYNHSYPAMPFRYDFVTSFIRNTNFFMQQIELFKDNYDENWRIRRIAEARVLRANFYHELWKAYGGVPLITEVLSQLEMGDDIFRPSVSLQELYSFMVVELGEAANDLPNEIGNGRVTRGAALALKAYIELYMGDLASDPRPSEIGTLGDPISYYAAAANTCNQIIDLGVYSLFSNYNDQFLAANNFNSESIWAIPHSPATNPSLRTRIHGPQASWYQGGEVGSYIPTQQLVDMYRMSNGLPIDNPASGYDPQNPYENREERFYQSIIHDKSTYRGALFTLEGQGQDEWLHRSGAALSTGYWRKKGLDPSLTSDNMPFAEFSNTPVFRYAEVLLMYAEAKFKQGQTDATAIDAVDQVRARGDLPTISETYGGIPEIDELLDIIWHERAVELSWEGYKHYWDLIRTRTADVYLNQTLTGVNRDQTTGQLVPKNILTAIWPSNHQYLFPIFRGWLERNPVWMDPGNQVNGRTAGQNPGY